MVILNFNGKLQLKSTLDLTRGAPEVEFGGPQSTLIYKLENIGALKLFLKVVEIPRSIDKIVRAKDAAPYIEAGLVVLNVDVPDVGNLTSEARIFPNGEFPACILGFLHYLDIAGQSCAST